MPAPRGAHHGLVTGCSCARIPDGHEGSLMVELGNLAGATGAEWIGGAQHEELRRGVRPKLFPDAPFYVPPEGFQHAEPGTVLRSRDVELALLGLIPQAVSAIQLLYRTTDMNGTAEAC